MGGTERDGVSAIFRRAGCECRQPRGVANAAVARLPQPIKLDRDSPQALAFSDVLRRKTMLGCDRDGDGAIIEAKRVIAGLGYSGESQPVPDPLRTDVTPRAGLHDQRHRCG
jgi:hypothetical protein